MLMSAEASMRHSRARIYPLTAQRARGPTTYLDVCGANDSRPHGRGATFPARPSFGSKPPPFNHMRPMRLTAAALLLVAEALAAQQPRQLTADDYARAERALAPAVAPLVSGLAGRATWLADGRFWYRATVPNGSAFFVVDPARRTREALFDATDNAGWVHSDRAVVSWSPDSRQIATYQQDERGVRDMYLVSAKVGAPQLEAWKYPLPGDSVIFRISRVIIREDGDGKSTIVRLQMPPDQHRSTVSDHVACGGGICDVEWYPDGSHLAFVSSSRDHKTAWFRVADAQTGAVRTLFEEHMPTQVGDASLRENLWRVLPASNELIWWSQRANWLHLYLYDLTTGQLKNQITTGEGNVDDIVRVDEKQRQVYFMRSGQEQPGRDPYFQQLYKIGFDGRGLTLL